MRNVPHIQPRKEAKVDEKISEIVGKEVRVNDPRLIKAAAERAKRNDSEFSASDGWDSKTNKEILKKHFS